MQKLQRKHKLLLIVIAVILVLAVALAGTLYATLTGEYGVKPEPGTKAKNVILLIGNGMGTNHVRAAATFSKLALDELPYLGKMSTRSMALNDQTDLDAAASAMATGVKVYNGRKSYLRGKSLQNLGDLLPTWGKKMGVVSTESLTDGAAPAFLTHHGKGVSRATLATEIAAHPALDVALGAAAPEWANCADALAERGAGMVNTIDQLLLSQTPVLGAFESITPNGALTLSTLTNQALRLLENENGFFLMVESNRIDACSRQNDFNGMRDELLAFDDAVEVAFNYAKSRGNTVVLVVSGHETGDLRLPDSLSTENLNDGCFHADGPTSQHVPYYAFGEGCENLPDQIDNTDVFYFISALLRP